MGQGMMVAGIKNFKETIKSVRSTSEAYSFRKRKGDRLVGLFLISCLANV